MKKIMGTKFTVALFILFSVLCCNAFASAARSKVVPDIPIAGSKIGLRVSLVKDSSGSYVIFTEKEDDETFSTSIAKKLGMYKVGNFLMEFDPRFQAFVLVPVK